MRIKKYYALAAKAKEASIYIFGDIVSWELDESDVSSYSLVKEIESLPEDIETINVYINSYGGEVAEGLAIYNVLRRHKAKVKTHCDSFACSAASVVFMAGDERIMYNASLLMIHNSWVWAVGNSDELHKQADDLKTINDAMIQAYMNHVSITEDKLKAMMDAETWLSAADALDMGFATAVVNPAATDKAAATLRLRMQMVKAIMTYQTTENVLQLMDAETWLSAADALDMGFATAVVNPAAASEPEPEPREDKLKVEMGLDGLADVLEARMKDLIAQATEPRPEPAPAMPEPKENKLENLLAALFAAEEEKP